jgi:hypothetical protein
MKLFSRCKIHANSAVGHIRRATVRQFGRPGNKARNELSENEPKTGLAVQPGCTNQRTPKEGFICLVNVKAQKRKTETDTSASEGSSSPRATRCQRTFKCCR